jgi:hypothetical protein
VHAGTYRLIAEAPLTEKLSQEFHQLSKPCLIEFKKKNRRCYFRNRTLRETILGKKTKRLDASAEHLEFFEFDFEGNASVLKFFATDCDIPRPQERVSENSPTSHSITSEIIVGSAQSVAVVPHGPGRRRSHNPTISE